MARKEILEVEAHRTTVRSAKNNRITQAGNAWWTEDSSTAANTILANLEWFIGRQNRRILKYGRFMRLYGNLPASMLNGAAPGIGRLQALQYMMGERLSFNLCQSIIDTLCAKITKNKPLCYFVTDGGTAKAQKIAKSRNRFIRGVFYEAQTHRLSREIENLSLIFGDGFLHVYAKNNKVCHEVVHPCEIWVDDIEAALFPPTQMIRAKHVPRARLYELYPDKKDVIDSATKLDRLDPIASDYLADLVTVVEAWRNASSNEAKDGAHMLCLTSGPLTDVEVYSYTDYPFAKLTYTQLPSGWWGQGLCEQLNSQQIELNKLLRAVQASLELGGTFKINVAPGYSIDHLNNMIGAVLVSDKPAQYITPQIVQPEIYQQIQTIKESAYQQAGINTMQASGTKPAGLNAGIAIREYNDLTTERFARTGMDYEDFFVQTAKLSMRVANEIVEETGQYETKTIRKASMEPIKWKDLQIQNGEEFVIQGFPVSSLPYEPAARLQTVIEYMQAGKIDDETAMDLLDFPDLGKVQTLKEAMGQWITGVIEGIIEDGDYTPPDPLMNLQMAESEALKYYAWAMKPGTKLPADRVEMLSAWMNQIDELVKANQAKQAQQQQIAQAANSQSDPTAKPTPTPQSELLPNAPPPPAQ